MFTLISTSPTFFSSGSSAERMLPWNASRSRLMSSIFIDAITWRICPKMMSSAWLLISAPEAQQAHRGVLLHLGSGADRHREDARHPHPDVLVLSASVRFTSTERHQRQEVVLLDDGPDERAAAREHLGRLPAAHPAGDHQDLVRGAALVARHEQRQQADEDHRRDGGADRRPGQRAQLLLERGRLQRQRGVHGKDRHLNLLDQGSARLRRSRGRRVRPR